MRIGPGVPVAIAGVLPTTQLAAVASERPPSDTPAAGSNQARLAAVVELIKAPTGRDVELVPPAPYLVSAPAPSVPVELATPPPPPPPPRDDTRPVRVDITDVLDRGTSRTMRLRDDGRGGYSLHPELDVTL
jgi:hypothetical protein